MSAATKVPPTWMHYLLVLLYPELLDDDSTWWVLASEHALVEQFATTEWRCHLPAMLEVYRRDLSSSMSVAAAKRELVRDQLRSSLAVMREMIPIDERRPSVAHLPMRYLHGREQMRESFSNEITLTQRWFEDVAAMWADVAEFARIFRQHVRRGLDNRLRRMETERELVAGSLDDDSPGARLLANETQEQVAARLPAADEAKRLAARRLWAMTDRLNVESAQFPQRLALRRVLDRLEAGDLPLTQSKQDRKDKKALRDRQDELWSAVKAVPRRSDDDESQLDPAIIEAELAAQRDFTTQPTRRANAAMEERGRRLKAARQRASAAA